MEAIFESKNAKRITVTQGINPRTLYEHQIDAMKKITEIDSKEGFKALLVLPTGGGKTLTAAYWLLKHAIDKKKKILWIAHRHLLLEQAAEAFINNTYSDVLTHEASYTYRIVSGMHDTPLQIQKEDNIIIASRDSIIRNLDYLGMWLQDEEVYLVIDEAHHATAKSYRRIIQFVDSMAKSEKLLGLTATPFRTLNKEKNLLSKIFTDDIIYKIDLVTLIKRGILSIPIHEICNTEIEYGDDIAINALKSIVELDQIPIELANKIAKDSPRNNIIVKKYFENIEKYGQTLVFAVNRIHAIGLKTLFEEYGKEKGIKAGIIVSSAQSGFVGFDVTDSDITTQIEAYKNGKIQILINVNILSEGTDLPKTQTVFLTRPTASKVLMTQMVGRALRGEKAGGTAEAYIVSFIDKWSNKIAWVNPSVLVKGENDFIDKIKPSVKTVLTSIAVDKLEECIKLVDNTVNTKIFEGIEFIKRIPLGMYLLDYCDENDFEYNHQILIYDSTKEGYDTLIVGLEDIFEAFEIEDTEFIEPEKLHEITIFCQTSFFIDLAIPPVLEDDIKALLKFYAQKSTEPEFVSIDDIDRKKLDLSTIAQKIIDLRLDRIAEDKYLNNMWEDEEGIIKIYYTDKYYFKKIIASEIYKILNPNDYVSTPQVKSLIETETERETRTVKNKLKEIFRQLKRRNKNEEGYYCCHKCGYMSDDGEQFNINPIFEDRDYGKELILEVLCDNCNN